VIQVVATVWASRYRRQLATTGVVMGIAVAVAVGGVSWAMAQRNAAAVEQEAQVAAWDSNSSAVAQLEAVSGDLPQRIREAVALRNAGFGAAADRVTWVEQTVAVLKRLRPLDYTVEVTPARPQALPDAMQSGYLDRGLEAPAFEVNDLNLRIQGLHENELLEVLDRAVIAGGGVVRTEYCKFDRRADGIGIDADCRLRRYGLPADRHGPPS
jgi:hypothetical protein